MENRPRFLFMITLIVLITSLSIIIYLEHELFKLRLENLQSEYDFLSDKYDIVLADRLRGKMEIDGVSGNYAEGIICFKVKDRTWSKVMETCSHEYLHYKFDDHFDK